MAKNTKKAAVTNETEVQAVEKAPAQKVTTVELKDGYNPNMILYYGRAIRFVNGEATVDTKLAKLLKQGGYVK